MRTYSVTLIDGNTKTIKAKGFQAALRYALEQYGNLLDGPPKRTNPKGSTR